MTDRRRPPNTLLTSWDFRPSVDVVGQDMRDHLTPNDVESSRRA